MNTLLDILKFTLPSLVMLAAVYIIFQWFQQQDKLRLAHNERLTRSKEILPLRLQAYERMILLLERISPSQLILRLSQHGMTAIQLQATMIQSIRDEFDHNLSQQLYISSKAWELIRNSREEMIRLINTAGTLQAPETDSNEFASRLLESYSGQKEETIARAIEFVKQEARVLF